jgi:hypothetical protein
VARTLIEGEQARHSIRTMVRRQGARLRSATPTAIVASLVAAACMPIVWPLVGQSVPESAKAILALLGATGGGYISDFVKELINRLRKQGGAAISEAQLQQALESELFARLESSDEAAAGLRTDAAALLQRVNGVEIALETASGNVQQALANAFTELGDSFREFGWMLRRPAKR